MRINWHRSFDSNNPTCRGINQGITAKPVGLCSFCSGNLDIKTSTCCDLPFRAEKRGRTLKLEISKVLFFLDAISLNSIRTISSSSPGKRTSKYLDIYVCVSVCCEGGGLAFPGSCFDSKCHGDRDLLWQRWCQVLYSCNALQKHGTYSILTLHTIFPGTWIKNAGGKNNLGAPNKRRNEEKIFFSKKRGAKTREHIMFHESASDKNGDTGNKRMSLRISWRDWRLKQHINVSRFLLLVWGYVWF